MPRFEKPIGLNALCTPAYLYFVLSIVMLIIAGISMNTEMVKNFCNGRCNIFQITMYLLIKLVFIVFWTWILNILCRGGARWLAWFLVLFPFIMMIAVFLVSFGNFVSGGPYISSNILPQPIQNGQPQPIQNGQTQPIQNGQPQPIQIVKPQSVDSNMMSAIAPSTIATPPSGVVYGFPAPKLN